MDGGNGVRTCERVRRVKRPRRATRFSNQSRTSIGTCGCIVFLLWLGFVAQNQHAWVVVIHPQIAVPGSISDLQLGNDRFDVNVCICSVGSFGLLLATPRGQQSSGGGVTQ